MNAEQELFNALMQAYQEHLKYIPEVPEYRWYYDSNGDIKMCSMISHPETDLPYIVVEKEIYWNYHQYYIKDSVAELIIHNVELKRKLKKSNTGIPTVPGHAALVLEKQDLETFDEIEYYDYTHRNS
jgi:hypothetical protein